METRDRLQVLDLGGGSQSTLNCFSGRNATIHFVDVYSSQLVTEPAEGLSAAQACEDLSQYLRLPDGVIFDVCMFWDALHYLPPPGLEGLSRALSPHIDANTLGYGFGALASGARREAGGRPAEQQGCRHGIDDQSHLKLTPTERPGTHHAYTQQQLEACFPVLTIQKATLLQEGRLELIFGRN